MSPSPNMRGLLLCFAVLACTTVSHSLVLLILLPIQLLFCFLFSAILRRLHLSGQTAVWLLAFGSGVALLRLAALTPYTLEINLPNVTVLLLCGAATPALLSEPPVPTRLWRVAAVMLLTGTVRELLAQGTTFGLVVISPPTITTDPVGSVLIAALFLWFFRLAIPVTTKSKTTIWNTVWLTLAVCSIKALAVAFLPSLSDMWIMALTMLAAALLSKLQPLSSAWAPLTPIVAFPLSDGWWHALVAAAITALVLGIADTLCERWRRLPLVRSFSGAPAALTITAVTLSVVSSF